MAERGRTLLVDLDPADRENVDLLREALAPLLAELVAGAQRPEPLIDADQAAELLCVPASWVREQARQNRIPHRKLGRYPRFKASELAAWSDTRAKGPVRR